MKHLIEITQEGEFDIAPQIFANSLEAAEAAQKKLDTYLKDIDLTETDDNGKLLHSAKTIMDMINNMPKTVKSIQELRKAVEMEQMDDSLLRAGREKGAFEDESMNPG
jgi:hypothetical protein